MKKTINRIVLAIAVVVVAVVAIIAYKTSQKQIKSGSLVWPGQADSLKFQTLALVTDEKNIWHIDLKISGDVSKGGRIKLGQNDSTTYREYKLEDGQTKIEYDGDWYSPQCYITVVPVAGSSGNLQVEADFVGN